MKKLVVTSLLAGAMVASAFAQGVVIFQNSSGTLVTFTPAAQAALGTTAIGPTGNGTLAGSPFVAGLYYAPGGPAADPGDEGMLGGVMVGGSGAGPAPFIASAGRFLGGNRTTPTTTAGGSPAWFQVRVWEQAYGATYEDAVRAGAQGGRLAIAGQSGRFNITTGAVTPTPIASAGGLTAFTITVVPEPSAIALGLLGLAGLFMLRRRNS